ncbi:MAG: mechanosensitive ion channel [Chloroflexi bacterium]|nr:MAG: mechanosensitive ion channel [Chloroflexota bacterium]
MMFQFNEPTKDIAWVVVGILVFVGFIIAARLVARFAGDQLGKRHVRGDMVVLGRRVVTGGVVLLGIFAALGFAVQSANVTLFGLLLATIVAALGVQQLLQDYVSGYYVLLEHHIRVGDRISFDGDEGTITEVKLRVTLLKNDEGDVVVVPNSELFTKPVTIRARAEPTTAPPT